MWPLRTAIWTIMQAPATKWVAGKAGCLLIISTQHRAARGLELPPCPLQLDMMRCLREVNVDNNTVGW